MLSGWEKTLPSLGWKQDRKFTVSSKHVSVSSYGVIPPNHLPAQLHRVLKDSETAKPQDKSISMISTGSENCKRDACVTCK